ncbi:MAG: 1-(5-phosphoribosyl)-5-[(5-phosphoribosylamino)methylideneamino]imidazole-4-carboxamide isomerase [Ignavibacteriales bacterium]|nr:MAG: 1-(5-phosphoribosyl)-5-[(5-phosphoribosylamino)methylideneamino]imidazole-4-carboxamide isomerase [Ignavibacteriales bacterium]
MIVIPAIDILDNKIVRLSKGDFNRVEFYPNSPLEQAKLYESNGFEWLHLVDLNGSRTGTISVSEIILEIKSESNLKIEFGGGIRSYDNVATLLALGIDKVIIGSLSIQNKNEFEKIISDFGTNKIIVAADVKDEMIAVKGWTENTSVSIYGHIEYCKSKGLDTFLCTDISTDGMLKGTNLKLYGKLMEKYPDMNLIASGGVKDINDVNALAGLNVYGVVIGKAIYENKIELQELKKFGE